MSDGDLPPTDVVHEAKARGLTGVAVTDHNGIWGRHEARAVASELGISCLDGIEISAASGGRAFHVLGYSHDFDETILTDGLTTTRQGYAQRIEEMVGKAHAAGYPNVSLDRIFARRSHQLNPCFVSFDVTKELARAYGMSLGKAHRIVISECYVGYGKWALGAREIIDLVHHAHGIAVLAHPGIIIKEHGRSEFERIFDEATKAGLDGIEVYHPDHAVALQHELLSLAKEHGLLISAGSDWHGPSRFPENNEGFGKIALKQEEYARLLEKLA